MNVARQWDLFGSVIPAAIRSGGTELGRERTSYFYRQQAIAWSRWWRAFRNDPQREMFRRLAKHYLAEYRKRKETR